jgi:peptidoglycan/xylan/chitin deacetylase (PgdA/CDA1 family)
LRIALKIDVDTLVGTQLGVPALQAICERLQVPASFYFSLGPDHTGRALRRIFRPGFLSKVSRTSVLEHYGLRTLTYGVLLPGPDIGRRCAAIMQCVRDAGFEVGIHTWDHILWQDFVMHRNAAWTERQLRLAFERFTEIFGVAPAAHCAAGWQMNSHAFRLQEHLGLHYASDTRGQAPFMPRVDGSVVNCMQLPTTLPTLDELIGRSDLGAPTPVAHLLKITANEPRDHVFTLHAELEGRKLAPWLEQLITGWRAQGYQLTGLGEYHASLDAGTVPVRDIVYGEVPGRSGVLALEQRA